jgi:wobble nucleotide-excising tRNase
MRELISVETDANLARNVSTNGIVNTNLNEYNKYLFLKKKREEESKTLSQMQDEIEILKTDLSEIKQLLISFAKNDGNT